LAERQVAEFVDDDEIVAQQLLGQSATATGGLFLFQLIDQIDQVEEAPPGAAADDRRGHCDAQMGFAGAGRTSVIMPGVRLLKCGSFILSIHDTARLLSRSAASATLALTI